MTVLPLSSNGTQRGRTVAPLHRFTFPSSGITVECHKLSPNMTTAITQGIIKECKALPADHPNAYPVPPTQAINYGTEKRPDIRTEEVLGGPERDAYDARMAAWATWAQNEMALRLITMVALDYLVIDPDILSAEVERVRRALKRQGADLPDLGIPLDGYTPDEVERLHFVLTCCMLDPQGDGQALLAFLVGRSQPREEEVQNRIASFRAPQQSGAGADVSE